MLREAAPSLSDNINISGINTYFVNHCNIGRPGKTRHAVNVEGARLGRSYLSVYWFLPSPDQPAKVHWAENIMTLVAAAGTA